MSTLRLTAIEQAFFERAGPDGECAWQTAVSLHTGQYSTPEFLVGTARDVIQVLQQRVPDLAIGLVVGMSFGSNGLALETKLFRVRLAQLAANLNAEVLAEKINPELRTGKALMKLGSSPDEQWQEYGYTCLFLINSQDLNMLLPLDPMATSAELVVKLGGVVIDDDFDRDLLVIDLICQDVIANQIAGAFEAYIAPAGLPEPVLRTAERNG